MSTLVSAALFLLVGFWLNLRGITGNPLYDGSVTAFTWGARIVGIGLLLIATLTWLRVQRVVMLDVVVSFLAAAGCIVIGAIWIAHQDVLSGALVGLFGLMNLGAARAAWARWRASQLGGGHGSG